MERDPREILVTFGEGIYKCLAKDPSSAALYTEVHRGNRRRWNVGEWGLRKGTDCNGKFGSVLACFKVCDKNSKEYSDDSVRAPI